LASIQRYKEFRSEDCHNQTFRTGPELLQLILEVSFPSRTGAIVFTLRGNIEMLHCPSTGKYYEEAGPDDVEDGPRAGDLRSEAEGGCVLRHAFLSEKGMRMNMRYDVVIIDNTRRIGPEIFI
jgi:hypothetical protein